MILSQEDNSSPALMSRAFNFYLTTVSILETTQKIPTLSDGNLECEELQYKKKSIKKLFFLYPFYQKRGTNSMITTNKVAIYVRVSTSSQAEEGYSIDEQKAKLEAYCEIKDWKIYDTYIDGGFSGANTQRPELERLISDVKRKKIDMVLVYKLDRLSRSQKDTLFLIEDVFAKNDVAFISLQENFDTSTPFGKASIGMLSVFAQLEREQIKERMMLGKEGRAKNGKTMSWTTIPFGYDYSKETGILTVNPTQALIVNRIFTEYLNGKSVVKIIRDLNAEGHVGRKRPWGETITKYLLKNETYLGKVKYKDNVYEGQHEPIITQELFDLVQLEVEKRQISALEKYNNPRPFRAKYMLSGLMKCGYCGASLGLKYTRKDKNGISHHKYQCRNRHSKDLEKRCESGWYSQEELEKDVIKELERLKLNPKYRNETLAKKEETIKVEEVKKQLDKLNNQVSKLTELYLDEVITRKELDEKNAKIKTERQFLEEQLENQKSNVLSIRKRKLTRLLKDFDVEKMSYEEASKIVKTIIKEIVVTKDDMTLTLDF